MRSSMKPAISSEEVEVLKALKTRLDSGVEKAVGEISEIAGMLGIRDNDYVLRALYTLEGKHLVSPEPEGDFTSNHWKITEVGVRAVDTLI